MEMSSLENCIKVTRLSQDVSKDKLKFFFQNKRNQGGGPVEKVILNRDASTSWALIYFKSTQAVQTILDRGNTVTIDGHVAEVSKYSNDASKERTRQIQAAQSKKTTASQMTQSTKRPEQRPVPERESMQQKTLRLDDQPQATKSDFPEQMDYEDTESLAERTIKATVYDVWRSKESYVYYLEDADVRQGNFEEDTMLLDCLNRVLYVTFENEDGAIRTCKRKHGSDSNFAKVELSSEADFDTYPNKVSVHGFNPKQKEWKQRLKEFARRKTGMRVKNVMQWNEPRSAILVFDEKDCEDISEVCWKLRTEFDGSKIISAPVFKTKSLLVSGFSSNFDKCLLKRYLSNARSGGGPVESVEWEDNVAIVTFKSEDNFFGVLEKEDHCLEGFPLQIEAYYDCLSKSAYKRWLSSTRTGIRSPAQEKSAFDRDESAEQECSADENEVEDFDFSSAEEISIDLDKKDIILLQNHAGILEEFQKKHRPLKVMLDAKSSTAKIRGDDSSVHKAATQLLQMTMKFESQKISSLSKSQLEVLKSDWIQHEVNAEFKKGKQKAVFLMENNAAFLYYIAPIKFEDLINVVRGQVQEDTKRCSDPNTKLLFATKEGNEFLSKLCENSDGSPLGAVVKYDAGSNSLHILAPHHKIADLHQRIDAFLKENMLDVKTVKYSEGKFRFIKEFKGNVINTLKEKNRPLGVMIKESSNSFEITGKKEKVMSVEKELTDIRDSIYTEDFLLRFFGIKEFMYERDGKRIKGEVERNLNCCIYLPTDFAADAEHKKSPGGKAALSHLKPIPEPKKVALANLEGYTLHFVQGDLLGLDVEAIVNPVNESKQLGNIGSFSKAILTRGGDQIQTDLLRTADSELVTVTSSGYLDKCQHILHVTLTSFDSGGGSNVKIAVAAALDCANKKSFASVGFPSLGSGKNFKYPNLTVCMQTMSAIKDHIEREATSPGDIYLCDTSDEMLSALLDRCEQTFPDAFIDRLSEMQPKPKAGPVPVPRRRSQNTFSAQPINFGHLKVKVHQGEITKWKIDAIVIAVDKSLSLKKGTLAKLVLRHGGDSLQQELDDGYSDGISPWEFAQSTGGNLKCQHIFYACIPHWKGENTQNAQMLQDLVEKILEEAENVPVTSLALPALGTGNLKYPPEVVAQAFNGAVENFSKNNPRSTLKTVDFVIYPQDTEVLNAFQSQMTDNGASPARPTRSRGQNLSDNEEEDDDDDDTGSSQGAMGFFKSAVGKVRSIIKGSNNKFSYGSVSLTVTKGDITVEKCDSIVCSIKSSMDLSASGAVCKNLLKKCGSSLQAECNNQQSAMQQTGVAKTSAQGLQCQNIYYVSMEKFGRSWNQGVIDVLTEAAKDGTTSIALPLLGSGARNPDLDKIKKKFLDGVEKFGKSQNSSLKDIRLVIFSQDMYDFFIGKGQEVSQHPSFSKPNKASPPKEPLKPKPQVSDRIQLKLYAKEASHAEKVKKELIQSCKKAFLSHETKNDKIKRLSTKQVQDLENTARENRVQIRVRIDDGVVDFKSFFPMNKVMSKLSDLMVEAVESHHMSLHQATTAAIVWQYREKEDKWRNFEPLMNVEIEREYKQKRPGCTVTDSQNRQYQLDFKAMEEFTIKQDGSLSKNGVKIRRQDKTRGGEPLPTRWDSMAATENLKLVPVKSGGEEYTRVETQFKQGGCSFPIKTIQRIQNKSLYQQYMVKKREMDLRNGKGFQNEKRLFHGTSPSSMTAINENGFSNNYSGVHATAYGEGSYFAVNSSYSQNYCQADSSGLRHMYVVRVLVGKSTRSSQGMKYLPNQPGTNTPFDSGTDGGNVMYVIFHDAQTYPEYLISF